MPLFTLIPGLAVVDLTYFILIIVGALLIGGGVGILLLRMSVGGTIRAARREAQNIRDAADSAAEAAFQKSELKFFRQSTDEPDNAHFKGCTTNQGSSRAIN